LGVRDIQKQETRERVLAAARDLFDEVGYEGATIRLVAQRAGVSVGSVFTTFSSKADILSQVMIERVDALLADIEALPQGDCALDCVKAVMAAHYRFEMRRPKLFLAHIIAAFTPELEAGVIPYGQGEHTTAAARKALVEGIARGEVDPATDLDLVVDMLRGIYAWNYRLAARQVVDPQVLIERCHSQADLLFQGLRPR
jgi:AcrR family transcriptional regulator